MQNKAKDVLIALMVCQVCKSDEVVEIKRQNYCLSCGSLVQNAPASPAKTKAVAQKARGAVDAPAVKSRSGGMTDIKPPAPKPAPQQPIQPTVPAQTDKPKKAPRKKKDEKPKEVSQSTAMVPVSAVHPAKLAHRSIIATFRRQVLWASYLSDILLAATVLFPVILTLVLPIELYTFYGYSSFAAVWAGMAVLAGIMRLGGGNAVIRGSVRRLNNQPINFSIIQRQAFKQVPPAIGLRIIQLAGWVVLILAETWLIGFSMTMSGLGGLPLLFVGSLLLVFAAFTLSISLAPARCILALGGNLSQAASYGYRLWREQTDSVIAAAGISLMVSIFPLSLMTSLLFFTGRMVISGRWAVAELSFIPILSIVLALLAFLLHFLLNFNAIYWLHYTKAVTDAAYPDHRKYLEA